MLELIQRLPRGRLLETGCGSGALLSELCELGFECSGLETSPAARELAAWLLRGHPEARLLAEPTALSRGAFDVVVALEVLEHIEDDRAALRAWRGWLRAGGVLLLSVPARPDLWSASDVWVGHFRRYDRRSLAAALGDAGFAIEHAECYGYPLSNLTEWLRARAHRRRLAGAGDVDPATQTARSGTDRGLELRFWSWQTSWLGRAGLRAGAWLQECFLDRDLGTGLLVVARPA